MAKKFVDCLMLVGTAFSFRGVQKLPEMVRPLSEEFNATNVDLSLDIQYFSILDSQHNLEVEMTALVNQKWTDPRLGVNIYTRKLAVAGQIWKPKIVNVNGVVTIYSNEDTTFWRGYGSEGNVILSEKMILKTLCTSDYRKFPFDTQICEFKFGSYRFPYDEVTLSWGTLLVTTDLIYNEFKIVNITTCIEMDIRSSGNFTVAVVRFLLKRHPEHYIWFFLLPCFILTLVNYVSLWFSLNKRKMRFYLNLSVLAIVSYFFHKSVCIANSTPYLKSIDVFVMICYIFSMKTFLQTTFVEIICTDRETSFNLKRHACSKEYSKIIFWSEYTMKLLYPVLYISLLFMWYCKF